ncbi:ubiquitinyl hydrolase [Aureococcus anophagefferens]|uniref:Ubiquitinyl hydrolase n=1 Tax=Aureococcus anophagefferens TaxID=44056 RepID=A0ABR1G131_AURAN
MRRSLKASRKAGSVSPPPRDEGHFALEDEVTTAAFVRLCGVEERHSAKFARRFLNHGAGRPGVSPPPGAPLGDRVALALRGALPRGFASSARRRAAEDLEDLELVAACCGRALCPSPAEVRAGSSPRREAKDDDAKGAETPRGGDDPEAPPDESAPERVAADRLWRRLRATSASGAVDVAAFRNALGPNVSRKAARRLFETVDETRSGVLHRAELVANLAPLLDSSAPPSEFRDVVRDAAFVWGAARPGDVGLERTIVDRLAAPRFGDLRARDLNVGESWFVVSRRWLDDWETYTDTARAAAAAAAGGDGTTGDLKLWSLQAPVASTQTLEFAGSTLGFTLGLMGHSSLRVRHVKKTCPHEARLDVDDALTHVNGEALVFPFGERDFTELLVRLKTAPRPLYLAFLRGDGVATRPRRGTCDKPNSVANGSLIIGDDLRVPRLRRDAQLGVDYEVLREDAWRALEAWYGADGAIERSVADVGGDALELELYPIFVDVLDDKEELVETLQISAHETLGRVDAKVRSCLAKADDDGEQKTDERRALLKAGAGGEFRTLETSEETLENVVGGEDRAWARLEPREEEGAVPAPKKKRWSFTSTSRSHGDPDAKDGAAVAARDAGLCNLGNTCYMNATVQALCHAPPIRDYFASGEYAYDVNVDSRYSPRGALAASFGDLVAALATRKGPVAPHKFRRVVGKFDATFAGYGQQDAFEFASKLLEGLGDDLSGIGDGSKPYLENPQVVDGRCDLDGVVDSENAKVREVPGDPSATERAVADACWTNAARREDHFVTTALTGQTRAKLDCKETGESLVLYEPFTALSVPLPHSAPRFDVHVRVSLASNRNWPVDVRVSLADAKDEGEAKAAAASFRGRGRSRGDKRGDASYPTVGDVLDELCALDDLVTADGDPCEASLGESKRELPAGERLDRATLVAGRVDDDDPSAIAQLLDDDDRLDLALRRGAPGVRLVVFEVVDVAARDVVVVTRDDGAKDAKDVDRSSPSDGGDPDDIDAGILQDDGDGDDDDVDGAVKSQSNRPRALRFSLRAALDAPDDSPYFLSRKRPTLLGAPFALRATRSSSCAALYAAVWAQIRVYFADLPRHLFDDTAEGPVGGRKYPFELRRAQPPRPTKPDKGGAYSSRRSRRRSPDRFARSPGDRRGFAGAKAPRGPRGVDDEANPAFFDDLEDGEFFIVDLLDAARDAFASSDAIAGFARPHASLAGDAPKRPGEPHRALRDDADRGRESSLQQCFEAAFKGDGDALERRSPKLERDAKWTRDVRLVVAPPVLVVHLKRFGETGTGRKVKRSAKVSFPLDGLRVDDFAFAGRSDAGAPWTYDLVAVVNHIGGLSGGHYTCACRVDARDGRGPRPGDRWLECNDRHVSDLDAKLVCSPQAYVLVYLRRDAPQALVREARPRRRDDKVDVGAILDAATKSSRRARSPAKVRPEKEKRGAAKARDGNASDDKTDDEDDGPKSDDDGAKDAPLRKSRGRKFVSGLMSALRGGRADK